MAAVNPATVRKWVERGQLPAAAVTPGGHYRFDPDEARRTLGLPEEDDDPIDELALDLPLAEVAS